jgi:hypothetical protein
MTDKTYNVLFLRAANSAYAIVGEACLQATRYITRRVEMSPRRHETPDESAGLTAAPGSA